MGEGERRALKDWTGPPPFFEFESFLHKVRHGKEGSVANRTVNSYVGIKA